MLNIIIYIVNNVFIYFTIAIIYNLEIKKNFKSLWRALVTESQSPNNFGNEISKNPNFLVIIVKQAL